MKYSRIVFVIFCLLAIICQFGERNDRSSQKSIQNDLHKMECVLEKSRVDVFAIVKPYLKNTATWIGDIADSAFQYEYVAKIVDKVNNTWMNAQPHLQNYSWRLVCRSKDLWTSAEAHFRNAVCATKEGVTYAWEIVLEPYLAQFSFYEAFAKCVRQIVQEVACNSKEYLSLAIIIAVFIYNIFLNMFISIAGIVAGYPFFAFVSGLFAHMMYVHRTSQIAQ